MGEGAREDSELEGGVTGTEDTEELNAPELAAAAAAGCGGGLDNRADFSLGAGATAGVTLVILSILGLCWAAPLGAEIVLLPPPPLLAELE
jgi:hypothetical protein